MNAGLSLFGGLIGGAVLAAAGWIAFVPAPGAHLEVDGYVYAIGDPHSVEGVERLKEAIHLRAQQQLGDEIVLHADEQSITGTAGEWGYRLDENQALSLAAEGLAEEHISFSENPAVWALRRFSSEAEVHSLTLPFAFDKEAARARLQTFAAGIDREATDAQLLIAEHRIIPSQSGRRLSVEATLVRLEGKSIEEAASVDVVLERTRPRVTEDDLAPVDVTRVLASYETSFRGKAGARAVNIKVAGKYLDGAIVLPGEVLSFNQQVGRRIHGRGFVDAPVIVNDELEKDVGGGVCQVATTLHAAAVYGNMEVVRRRSHSRPSGYAPLGLDATVIDGKVDLQLRNPFDEPILVHVSFPSTYKIRVELLGRDPDVKVEHAYSVTHREPFARRVWRKEEAPLGGFKLKQKGSQGMDVVSTLRIKHEDGHTSRRSYRSKYYPVPEVFWIGRGASPNGLPEMSEEIVALVVDGEEVEGAVEKNDQEEVPSLHEADSSDREPRHRN